jgi:hypothetical protein
MGFLFKAVLEGMIEAGDAELCTTPPIQGASHSGILSGVTHI